MHSMWKGAISFGLVMIPVRLYAATEQKDISFRQVHRADGGRIKFRRICSADGEEVLYEDVAKGYELPTGEMVILTDEDMADLPLPSTKSIEVLHFAPAEQLDPILFNRSYFVEPETAGTRAYVLLRNALEQSGRVAVAQVALRQRESLATLRVRDGVLVLETLLWPDEVREALFPFLDQDVEVRPQELAMAASLIDSMTVDFDSAAYHDGYREALIELVEAKITGHELLQPGTVEIAATPASSLADALRASLAAAQEVGAVGAGPGEPKSLAGPDGTGRSAGAGSGEPKSLPAGKSSATKAPATKAPATKEPAAKESAAKESAAKPPTAKAGSAKTGTTRAKKGQAAPVVADDAREAAG
jgi:DNA end-binding protein Ku